MQPFDSFASSVAGREPDLGAVAIDEPLHAQLDGFVRRAPWNGIDRRGRVGGRDGDARYEGDHEQAA